MNNSTLFTKWVNYLITPNDFMVDPVMLLWLIEVALLIWLLYIWRILILYYSCFNDDILYIVR